MNRLLAVVLLCACSSNTGSPPTPQTTPQGYRVIEAGEVPAGTGQVQPSPGTHFCRRGHTAQIIEIPQSLQCSTVENMD